MTLMKVADADTDASRKSKHIVKVYFRYYRLGWRNKGSNSNAFETG